MKFPALSVLLATVRGVASVATDHDRLTRFNGKDLAGWKIFPDGARGDTLLLESP